MDKINSQASKIISNAFLQYPLMLYAFEGRSEAQRAILLYRLHSKCVSAASIYGQVVLSAEQQGALIWLPGKSFPVTLPMEIRSGMALLPLQIGLRATFRLLQHDGESEGWIAKNAGSNMGYVWVVGVLREGRGKGISRLLIEQSITQMRQQGITECWLKTEDPKNVTIYQKLGFTRMNEMVVKSSGIKSWAMRRMI